MNPYQEEEAQKKATLKRIAEAVAPLLENGWHIDTDHPDERRGISLISEGERRLLFDIGWSTNDRLEIYGSFDNGLAQYLPYQSQRPKTEISVAVTKTPEKIAQDIKRRLLPNYEQVLAAAKEYKKRDDDYKATRKQAMEQIKTAIGGDVDFLSHTQRDELYGYKPYSFEAKYHSNDEIEFTLTLPFKKALEVLKSI